jgi:hypothetical protein
MTPTFITKATRVSSVNFEEGKRSTKQGKGKGKGVRVRIG